MVKTREVEPIQPARAGAANTGRSFFDQLSTAVRTGTRYVAYAGMMAVIFMVFLTGSDVVGRWLRHPIPGALEMTQLSMSVIVSMALAWTMAEGGHVRITIILDRLAPTPRAIVTIIGRLLTFAIWSLIAWQSYMIPFRLRAETTEMLRIPLLPFKVLVALGAFMTCLVLIVLLIDDIRKVRAAR